MSSLQRLPTLPQAPPGRITHLVGEESIPLVLLGSCAVHPLEDSVLDEDRQCSKDEGCKQVQVDIVPGAVQVPGRETGPFPGKMANSSALQPWLSG
jgi:hypothetical protein